MFYDNLEIFYEYKDHFRFEYFDIKKKIIILKNIENSKNSNFEKSFEYG